MDRRNLTRAASSLGISDVALSLVMGYVDDPRDRAAASLVCRKWCGVDGATRKRVTVAFCYSATPDRLRRRFPCLESLKIKAKPRAAMFDLIPDDWGGYAAPWIADIARSFECLTALHLRRMVVTDADLALLVRGRGPLLLSFKLDRCSGFSTDALALVARSCRYFLLIKRMAPFLLHSARPPLLATTMSPPPRPRPRPRPRSFTTPLPLLACSVYSPSCSHPPSVLVATTVYYSYHRKHAGALGPSS